MFSFAAGSVAVFFAARFLLGGTNQADIQIAFLFSLIYLLAKGARSFMSTYLVFDHEQNRICRRRRLAFLETERHICNLTDTVALSVQGRPEMVVPNIRGNLGRRTPLKEFQKITYYPAIIVRDGRIVPMGDVFGPGQRGSIAADTARFAETLGLEFWLPETGQVLRPRRKPVLRKNDIELIHYSRAEIDPGVLYWALGALLFLALGLMTAGLLLRPG